jgi:hypothetical protein
MLTVNKVKDLIKTAIVEYHTSNHAGTPPAIPAPAADKATVPYTKEDLQVDGAAACWPSYKQDLDNDEFLLENTKMDSLLLKALTDRGFASRFPKDARKKCLEALKARITKMSDEEKSVFHSIITNKNFSAFSVMWQEIHTEIEKKI